MLSEEDFLNLDTILKCVREHNGIYTVPDCILGWQVYFDYQSVISDKFRYYENILRKNDICRKLRESQEQAFNDLEVGDTGWEILATEITVKQWFDRLKEKNEVQEENQRLERENNQLQIQLAKLELPRSKRFYLIESAKILLPLIFGLVVGYIGGTGTNKKKETIKPKITKSIPAKKDTVLK